MKNQLLVLMEDLGIAWKYLINGLIGGFVWSVYRKSPFLEALRQIVIGSIVAGYFTPIVVIEASIPLDYVGAISFLIGVIGMISIDTLYKYVLSRAYKWKEAFIELIKKLVSE